MWCSQSSGYTSRTDAVQLPDIETNSALFILKTRDGRRITQTCLDGLISDVSLLVHQNLQYTSHCTLEALRKAGASEEILAVAQSSILPEGGVHLFEGMDTEYLQNLYFRENFGLVVSE